MRGDANGLCERCIREGFNPRPYMRGDAMRQQRIQFDEVSIHAPT